MFAKMFRTLPVVIVVLLAGDAAAQTTPPPEWERTGFQPNRDYLRLLPFERLDTQTGNAILTLPQLTLPGNAGRNLQFVLTYNANSVNGNAPWAFGIAGMAMKIDDQATPGPGPLVPNTIEGTWGITPLLYMADGGARRTMFIERPSVSTQSVMTSDFWRYDRQAHELYLPDGTICLYDATTGKLTEIRDPFNYDNRITLTWAPTNDGLTVVQHLGDESRTVTFVMNGRSLPTEMTYLDRTWQYLYDAATGGELESITPPEGPGWTFTNYTPLPPYRRLRDFTTPNGGTITYDYTQIWITPTHPELFLTGRAVGGPPPDGEWPWSLTYTWADTYSAQTIVTTPSARITYAYGPTGAPTGDTLIDGAIGPTHVYVHEKQANGTFIEVEHEDRMYQHVGVIDQQSGSSFDGAELQSRVVWRGATSYTTTYTYDTANHGDCHHPKRIVETGQLTRTTDLTYSHPQTGIPVIVGLPVSETVTENGESFVRTWSYDNVTGFKIGETEFGETSCCPSFEW
jgi:hypothetical protein